MSMKNNREELELMELLKLLEVLERCDKKVDDKQQKSSFVRPEFESRKETKSKEDEFNSTIKSIVDVVVLSLKSISNNSELFNTIASIDSNMFTAYMKQGFTREEAYGLVIESKQTLNKLAK